MGKQNVTPLAIVVAVIALVVLVFALYKRQFGAAPGSGGDVTIEQTGPRGEPPMNQPSRGR
ncbi:MAG: hypothetical protein NZT92_02950 [Abditibacteriales bacterium]|nr:hypothetical protein [Abditibacteriales bacterium]MDW8365067.1 hypothetical protein [Abditibacteriales bacterium]